ncbi:uncharacterized protein DUF1648 [Glaciihabitans tibetensis]|uniref:Uncharacterized protein DUF1648 n=1 Tax=Glaciihabitans tibetensis TaxID=1266600 RepID=A0A2T0VIU7_9MICO|nr:DUF1648 domain-containing protein [Glaciihabitans tibetensis]PRY70127.1 uncharacterized protein DUF1648 [Glaciihabitans tibetensis]
MTLITPTRAPRAYSPGQVRRIIGIGGVTPVVFALIGCALMASWAPELPDPIAIHWGAGGSPDGYGSLASVIAMLLGYVVLFSAIIVVSVVALRSSPQRSSKPRLLIAGSIWLSTVMAFGLTGLVWAQRGLADAADTGSVVAPFVLGVAVGLVFGTVAWFLTPVPARLDASLNDGAQPAMALASHERVSWSRSSRPATRTIVVFFAVFGVLSLGSVLSMALTAAPWMWVTVLLLCLVLLASAVCFYWRVSVDQRGVSVRSEIGVPTFTIPLDEISGARVVQVNPLVDFGGWGLRWTAGKTGIVVCSGEAIEVTRKSGKMLVVTVDDADTAVALLEGLLRRRDASVPPAASSPPSTPTVG